MSPNVTGALLMMASMVCFTLNDAFIKLTGGALPIGQLMTVRGAMASVFIFGLAAILGGLRLDLGAQAWRLIVLRALTEIATAYFFLNALLNMPLANVSAIMQALPLTVAFGAFLIFKDPIGWRRLSAILVGLVGVMLILRPGPEGFSIWSFYVALAVLCVTGRDLVTRKLPAHVPSMTVAVANTVNVFVFFGLLSLGETWQPMTAPLWGYLIGSSVFIVGGYYFSVTVMRVGEISFIAPFRYTSLVTALILGLLVFGEWPDGVTLLGAAIVVGAGLFTLWREAQIKAG